MTSRVHLSPKMSKALAKGQEDRCLMVVRSVIVSCPTCHLAIERPQFIANVYTARRVHSQIVAANLSSSKFFKLHQTHLCFKSYSLAFLK